MDFATSSYRAWAVVTIPRRIINQIGLAVSSVGMPSPLPIGLLLANTPVDVVLDIGRWGADWELNAIPNAHLTVAVGRRADNITQIAAIHRIVNRLKSVVPISIFVEVDTSQLATHSERDAWPTGAIRAFRGYISSTGFRRHENSLEFVLNAGHWLMDLDFSSSLSRSSHHMNPAQTSFNAAFPDLATSGGVNAPHATGDTMPGNFFPSNVITQDFWGFGRVNVGGAAGFRLGGLKEFLKRLSSVDRIYTTPTFRAVFGQTDPNINDEKNWEALRALQHFEPNATYNLQDGSARVTEAGYVDGVPLSMDMAGAEAIAARHVATAVGLTMGRETFSTLASHTLWNKLVGQYAPLFLFSVVPMVEKALITPFTPGLQWANQPGARYFRLGDYNHFEFISQNSRPIRAVFLQTGMGFNTGFDTGRDSPPAYSVFGPKYISPNSRNVGGLILFKEAPRWLTDLGIPFLYPTMSAPISTAFDSEEDTVLQLLKDGLNAVLTGQPDGVVSAILGLVTTLVEAGQRSDAVIFAQISALGFALSPVALGAIQAVLAAVLAAGTARPSNVYRAMTTLWDRYAQALYVQEKTKGRQATLSGRFRLDTAPGTVVKIENNSPDLNFRTPGCPGGICVDDNLRNFYGTVLRVSCWMDAQANKAGTSFQIGFMRDEAEERGNALFGVPVTDYTVSRHPIWSTNWYGAPLVVERDPATDKFRHRGTSTMAPTVP